MIESEHWHWPGHNGRTDITDYDDPSQVLFTRWFVFGCPLFCVMIHKLRKSDGYSRGLHDHPWNFISFVLSRANYREVRRGRFTADKRGNRIEKPHFFRFRRATDAHRVVLNDERRPVWTLVIHGRRLREWGFYDGYDSWRPWHTVKPAGARDYHDNVSSITDEAAARDRARRRHPSQRGMR